MKSTNIIYFDDLNDFEYEVYCINLNKTPANYKKTKDKFLEILERNFRFVHGLRKAQIVKMEGEKILGIPIYHHHAIFSDKDKFKIVSFSLLKYLNALFIVLRSTADS